MKLLILLIIGVILYFIARSYKTEKFQNINLKVKENFTGDLMNHEAGMLVALMAKVAKADGQVSELEAQILKHTFSDISSHFQNSEEIRQQLVDIYNNEKEHFDNTMIICENLYKVTKHDYAKRVKVLEYLINLAYIDKEFSQTEQMITEDIAKTLQIKQNDYERIVNGFKQFYDEQRNTQAQSLEEAYKTLSCEESDTDAHIKKQYRDLVKKHHPDIIAGQGASQNIIDQATKKLQEINEAYEAIKQARKNS